jgi:hypothetical protein
VSIKKYKLYEFVNKNAAPIGLFIAVMSVSTAAILSGWRSVISPL